MAKKASGPVPDGDRERMASILYWFDQEHDLNDAAVLPENFTLADAEIKLGITLQGTTAQAVEYVRFYLADTAWELFHRLHPDGPVPGEGLGLKIVRRIVVRHRGRVWVESAVGEGSRFFVALPAAGAGARAMEGQP